MRNLGVYIEINGELDINNINRDSFIKKLKNDILKTGGYSQLK